MLIILLSLLAVVLVYCIGVWKLLNNKHYFLGILLIFSPYIAYKLFQYHCYVSAIPSAIEVTWPVSMGEDSGFREGCGTAVFRLSGRTLVNIAQSRLHYFDGVTQARGHQDSYHTYKPWQETPIPATWQDHEGWLLCPFMDDDLLRQIYQAAKEKGAYYTTKPEAELVVIPSLKIAVFSFFG
jgi:hypothetical protein